MVSPASLEEVRFVVQAAAQEGVPLAPQGGNTSMVAGATPDADGRALLLSMRRMRKIRTVSGEDNALVAAAGVILSDVHGPAEAADRLTPLSHPAKGYATAGGRVVNNGAGV